MIKNDIRRVQRSGKGSLMISLPKDYCEENGIAEGTAIRMIQADGLLLRKVEG
jgi:hypothetical protein